MPATTGRRWNARVLLVAAPIAIAAAIAWTVTAVRPTAAEWAAAGPSGGAVPIMSFNVLRGGQPVSATLDAIAQAAPDVVCLQELTPRFADAFENRLGSLYPHRLFESRHTVGGIGIASRHPLSDAEVLDLDLPTLPAAAGTVEIGSARVRIACVHLMPPHAGFRRGGDLIARYERNRDLRVRQVELLVEALDRAALPAVILGDMNEWWGQDAIALLASAGFADACSASGARCGATWPGAVVPLPALFRIDHILGRGLAFTATAVLDAEGSDHFPVAARIVAPPAEPVKVSSQ